eukprot:TRINITY_DN1560_c0_g1_i1.p1 TRINITY_DN1560_c0_g1~~TRINITY_DN1560_c0_g1_i1.p1  ORF type:complete len:178 (+),score=40.31 TRINITY_DN1560_c0_g1_i1:121-654(+)
MQRGLVGSEMCIRDSINAEYMGYKMEKKPQGFLDYSIHPTITIRIPNPARMTGIGPDSTSNSEFESHGTGSDFDSSGSNGDHPPAPAPAHPSHPSSPAPTLRNVMTELTQQGHSLQLLRGQGIFHGMLLFGMSRTLSGINNTLKEILEVSKQERNPHPQNSFHMLQKKKKKKKSTLR